MTEIHRQRLLQLGGAATAAAALPSATMWPKSVLAAEQVKHGLLHSFTGPIPIAEASLDDAETLAIDEINASVGVSGHPVRKPSDAACAYRRYVLLSQII